MFLNIYLRVSRNLKILSIFGETEVQSTISTLFYYYCYYIYYNAVKMTINSIHLSPCARSQRLISVKRAF